MDLCGLEPWCHDILFPEELCIFMCQWRIVSILLFHGDNTPPIRRHRVIFAVAALPVYCFGMYHLVLLLYICE